MKNAPARPRRPVEDRVALRQEEILDTAAKLFGKHGYAETDTQLVADKLGVGKGTLYRYFASKRELFLRDEIDTCIVGIEDPLQRIEVAIRAYLRFFADHPEFVELLMQERAQFKDREKPTYFVHREKNIEPWRALYRSLIGEGRVRNMPVERILDIMTAACYGTMFINYFTGAQKPPEAQARDILDVIFNGILSDAERRRRTPE
jgi:AcrR family transcriptional regulator